MKNINIMTVVAALLVIVAIFIIFSSQPTFPAAISTNIKESVIPHNTAQTLPEVFMPDRQITYYQYTFNCNEFIGVTYVGQDELNKQLFLVMPKENIVVILEDCL